MVQPYLHFNSQTYVAFSDLCGLKQLMKERKVAYDALNYLFNTVYELLESNTNVKALAVSDCVISWSNDRQLQSIVDFASQLHRKMIERRFLMKTTIAYGEFQYQDRIELSNLSKEMIWGGAYVDAFIANEKVDAGRIILIENSQQQNLLPNPDMWKKIGKRWEYFWSAQNTNDIQKIIEGRKKANKIKYERLKDIYQGNLQNEEQQPQCGS